MEGNIVQQSAFVDFALEESLVAAEGLLEPLNRNLLFRHRFQEVLSATKVRPSSPVNNISGGLSLAIEARIGESQDR